MPRSNSKIISTKPYVAQPTDGEPLPCNSAFYTPTCGGVPTPPAGVDAALQLLFAVRPQPPTIREALRDDLAALPRALVRRAYRDRSRGLSRPQTRRWAAQAAAILNPTERAAVVVYARACRAWLNSVAQTTQRRGASYDWTATAARNVAPNNYERALGAQFAALGLPVEAQVGVAKQGGRRRGGWFGAYWLDWAHRDRDYLLRLDIEMDGQHHQRAERMARDAERNACVQRRGWYVLRVTSAAARRPDAMQTILATVAERARWHRQAVVLARSEVRLLARLLNK